MLAFSIFPSDGHDHAACLRRALSLAQARCEARRVKLTPIRRRILEIVLSSHKPIGAYEILAIYKKQVGRAAPPTIYRALDFLVGQGLAHHIKTLNAYFGCGDPGHDRARHFLICADCGRAAELSETALPPNLETKAKKMGFAIHDHAIEIIGRCAACRNDGKA